ncbi:MAG: TolC family protein [Myxococcales bacterium]
MQARLASLLLLVWLGGCGGPRAARAPTVRAPASYTRQISRWTSGLEHPLLRPIAVEPADGFDPDEVALLAVVTNPGLRTARDRRAIAHSQVIAAGLLPNPSLSLSVYAPISGNTDGSVVGYSGTLAWSVQKLFTRGPQVHAAELAQRSVELDIAWSEWSVALQAQLLAYQILLLQQAQGVHQANIAELQATLSSVRHAADAGAITASRLASIEAVLSQAQLASANTNRDLDVRKAELQGLLGGMEGVVDRLTGALDPPASIGGLQRDALLERLAERRPDLRALEIGMRSQSAAYRAATRKAFPALQLNFQASRDPGGFWAIGPGLQIGIPSFSHGQAGQAAADAQLHQLDDMFAERLNQARQRIGVALARLRGTRTAISILDQAVARQQRVVELYQAARSEGTIGLLVYYAARSTLNQLRLRRLLEQGLLWQALVQLRSESGLYRLPGAGGEDPGGADALQ